VKSLGAAFVWAFIVLGIIGFGVMVTHGIATEEAHKNAGAACAASCTPYVSKLVDADCYCIDARRRYHLVQVPK
jgi:hypothetical protein